ncbi:MAG: redox-regulated ATPase YchF [Candidatus Woesearchaeota archaeon]
MLIGIVGKPNCGKSTFFKATTLANVEIANYPFATIKPNKGIGFVKVECASKFFNVTSNPRTGYVKDYKRFVPVDIIDVAGLVPGAHEGKGMGLEFLNDLNQADALIHVIDVSGSTNEKGEPVDTGSYDPANDIKFLDDELTHWYLSIMNRNWDKFSRSVSQTNQDPVLALNKQFSGLGSKEDMIKLILKEKNLNKTLTQWSDEDKLGFADELRKRTKPVLIVANKIDVKGGFENYERLKKEFSDYIIVPASAATELALKEGSKSGTFDYIPGDSEFKVLKELNENQKKGIKFIEEFMNKYKSTGVQEALDRAVFELLGYVHIFPGGVNKLGDKDGNILPDCFLLPKGSTAIDFAYKLHTDIGDNFIKAIDVKTKRTIGKDHILKPGDVIEILN